MSRPNPIARRERTRNKILRDAGTVSGLREAFHLAPGTVPCPNETCGATLEVAFPHPVERGALLSKCPKCRGEWKFGPALK